MVIYSIVRPLKIAPLLLILLILLILLASHAPAAGLRPQTPPPSDASSLASDMDPSIRPGVDFYHYANGSWLKKTPIPADKPRWGSFDELREQNWKILKAILEEASNTRSSKAGSIEQKTGDFYASAMDTAQIESSGLTPLKPFLDGITAIHDRNSLIRETARLQSYYINPLFSFGVDTDEKDSEHVTFYFGQGGLGMPSREYYIDDIHAKIREAYLAHLRNVFKLMGESDSDAARHAQTVLSLETDLAKVSRTRVQLRDPLANYNKMPLDKAVSLAPAFPWKEYLTCCGLDRYQQVILGQPEFFKALSQYLQQRPLEDWKAYLRWHVILECSPYLGTALELEHFHFYGTVLNGTREMEPRWQRATRQTDQYLGEALGQLYVARRFSPEAKKRALGMVANIQQTFRSRLEHVDWMSPETRAKALQKFAAFRVKIGYPDKWIDYSRLDIDRGPYIENVLRARHFDFQRRLDKVGGPVDKTEWQMTPSTVNAYFNGTGNEIVFPAGILQPPFFDPQADDAVNYGGIGAVIAHEITHGYDDQGRMYDSRGNLNVWWSMQDSRNFKDRSQILVDQFNKYEALPGLFVNGRFCLGENIADLGGVTVAYEALQHTMTAKTRPPLIEGFTSEQRFFLSWAKIWRVNCRPEALRQQILVDPHSPGPYRTIGAPTNMEEFFQAFGIKEGDPLWRPLSERCKIW